MEEEVLALPDHLRDALFRVDSARLAASPAAGVCVCAMGGSAIGADLAAAALGGRLRAPLITVRAYGLPAFVDQRWTVLCASYSGDTEETLACFEAARARGARCVVAAAGGALIDAARAASVPVIGLPAILPAPRTAVAYLLVCAAEVAFAAGAAPSLREEVEAAAGFLAASLEGLKSEAEEIAAALAGRLAFIYGAELTAAVARRWKTQINENAKLPAIFSELPEADHNELCGWQATGALSPAAAVFLADKEQDPRDRRRLQLTAAAVSDSGAAVLEVRTRGERRLERLMWGVALGDLVSLALAEARGVDPLPVEAIERLKAAMGRGT